MQSLVENFKVINTCLKKRKEKQKKVGRHSKNQHKTNPGLLGFKPVTALGTYTLYYVETSALSFLKQLTYSKGIFFIS